MKNSTLDDIAAIIGFTTTIRLAAHYGGRDLTVPTHISDLHPLAKLIGMSALNRLHQEWAGERLSVPTLTIAATELRDARILRLLRFGNSAEKIAQEVGMTTQRVLQIRRAFEADGILPMIFSEKAECDGLPHAKASGDA